MQSKHWVVILGIILAIVTWLKITDTDPKGYYEVLRIPSELQKTISTLDIENHYDIVTDELAAEHDLGCDFEFGFENEGKPEGYCKGLLLQLQLAEEAKKVLTNPQTKAEYDNDPWNQEAKDWYSILQVTPDATMQEMKANYKRIVADLADEITYCRAQTRTIDHNNDNDHDDSEGDSIDEEGIINNYDCKTVMQRRNDVENAALVLGDDSSRRVYLKAIGHDDGSDMSFISSPLALLADGSSSSPFKILMPIIVLIAVLTYISNQDRSAYNQAAEAAQKAELDASSHGIDDNDNDDDDGDDGDDGDDSHQKKE